MIKHLDLQLFRKFGTISPKRGQDIECGSEQTQLQLVRGEAPLFRARKSTWICNRRGMTILSASTDGREFTSFYLDKPVQIAPGIYFSLSTMRNNSSIVYSTDEPPEPLGQRKMEGSLLLKRQIQITNLYTFFYQEKEAGFLFPGESHPMLELTYVDCGSMHSVVDGNDILLQQYDMMLYGPDQWHMQYSDVDVAPRFITISFDMSGCDLSHLYNKKIQSPTAGALLRDMLREQEQEELFSADMILNHLSSLLILLCRDSQKESRPQQLPYNLNNEKAIVQRAQQYISDHVQDLLTVPIVANGIHISHSYMTALFHKHLNISPGEYIRRIKLQESKQLIREGTMNITQIAATLHYSTVHHFSRQFKEKFGMTPMEYARSVR